MYRIALVEDQKTDADILMSLATQYQQKYQTDIQVQWYHEAVTFLEEYTGQFDIVFMDIQMPMMNGMEAARKLREKDENVILFFLTSLAQYALQGYEVEALDFIVKPISWPVLEMKLRRALPRCRREERPIVLENDGTKVFLKPDELLFVEIFDHHIQYQTANGILRDYGTLKKVEEQLPSTIFFRINNQTLVNLRRVVMVDAENALVADKTFSISQRRRKGFVEAVHLAKTGR